MIDTPNILITGATDGIGLRLARWYIAEGANVALTGRRNLSEVADFLPADAIYIEADQSKPEQAASLILDGLNKAGWRRLDLAILNAGNGQFGAPFEEDTEVLRNTLDVNLVAPILISHTLAPLLDEASSGKLVLIGSTSHKGAANFASYATAKASLNGFSRSLKEEWKGRIDVQIIHPGPTDTKMHTKAGFDPGIIKHIFLDPQFVTREIVRKISKQKSPVSIGFPSRIIDFLTLRHWTTR